jgi:hypothetical protein
MIKRKHYIFILSAACIALSIGMAQVRENSVAVQRRTLPWGNADLTKTSDGMSIRFMLHQQREIQKSDSSSLPLQVPSYSCFVQVPSGSNVDVQIQRHSSHNIAMNNLNSPALSALLKLAVNVSSPLVQLQGYRWFRGKRLAQIRVSAYTNNAQSVQAIDTVEVALHYTTSSTYRSLTVNTGEDKHFKTVYNSFILNADETNNAMTEPLKWLDSTGTWLPHNGKAIKLTIPNDGVYRLTYSNLTAITSELSQVDPRTFRLFNKGSELPLQVKIGNTGQFDYVEFVGLRNYNGDAYRHIPVGKEEYNEYLNRYTDTSYYWLTWGGAQGKRYISNDTTTSLSIDSLQWYTEKLHIEQNTNYGYIGSDQIEQQNPFWTSGDIWYWGYLFANGEFDIPFSATQLNTSLPTFRIYVKVANAAADLGVTPVSVLKTGMNSYTSSDTTALNQFDQKIIQKNIPLSALSEGSNTLRIYSLSTPSSVNSVVLDWADIEYPRTLQTVTDSLWFGFSDLSSFGVRRVIIQGLSTADCIIYKVQSTPKIIAGYKVSGNAPYSMSFIDTVRNGDRYMLLSSSKVQTPVMSLKNSFANLRDSTQSADYLLITNSGYSGFSSLAKTYSAFIHQTFSLNATVIDVKDIYDEFGYGYPVPESVREFLKATTKWVAPMPSYVFLVGRANYDFKNYMTTTSGGTMPDIVPVYGMPVSDSWAAMLDDSLFVPQLYVGRLPALTDGEFQRYFQHVQTYASAPYDDWNKRYIFFAGGDSSATENTIGLFHSVNSQVLQSLIQPAPIGGVATDFYKTTNPQSDYGPYSQEQFNNAIDSGAVLIGYVGHSGTQTWDNNIADIAKLQNTRGRFTLISDFGCSTAKCAEPNIRAFSELFTLDQNSSAIGYIGNSSLGFTSIATSFPQFFYRTILQDTIHTIGKAHLVSKIQTLQANGWQNADMGRQLMLTNILIGDPAIELAIPVKPNLSVSNNDLSSTPTLPSDDNDYLHLKIPYHNYGSVPQDSFQVKISQTYLTGKSDTTLTRRVPLYADTLNISYPIYNLPGTHDYAVQFNPSQILKEISYSDNSATYSTVVQSIALRAVYPVPGFRSPATKFVLMNPIKQPVNAGSAVILELDTTLLFTSPSTYQMPLGQVATKFTLPQLSLRQYYWRAHIGSSSAVTGSFIPSSDSLFHWTQSLPEEWQQNTYTNTIFDSSGVHLSPINHSIRIVSSGFLTGRYGSVEIDGSNVLGSTFDRGITVAQLDTMDFHVIQRGTFDTFGGSSGTDTSYAYSLAVFINNLPQRSLVAMLVIDEGSNSLTAYARNSIKQFGSTYISNLGWRDSWALLGQKGSPAGSALEKWAPSADSQRVTVDTTMSRPSLSGELLSEAFGFASQWTKASITSTVPQGGRLRLYVLGTNSAGTYDTLLVNETGDTSAVTKLTTIDAKKYSSLRLLEKYWASAQGISPTLKKWDVTLLPPPELAINYQCVSLSADSVIEGTPVQITAQIHNIGDQAANNVQVLFSLMNNGIRQQDTLFIPAIPADSFSTLQYQLQTGGRRGANVEFITIDPQQLIAEEFKINNSYSFPFFVWKDTTAPSFDITFDGQRIYDGDYVLPHPTIRIAIYDNSPLQIKNPSFINLTLDDRRIALGSEPDSLFEVSSGPEKAVVTFRPKLVGKKDPYTLWVQVQDSSGNTVTMANPLHFIVDSVWDIKNVFNYPNPFSSETYFTFILTDYADEVEIKIYTIAGRLIQTIIVSPQSENAYFRVYWNGRDRDGDEVANGVYFYKVIAKSNGATKEVIGKLAKVR